jgi:hypothetical protein
MMRANALLLLFVAACTEAPNDQQDGGGSGASGAEGSEVGPVASCGTQIGEPDECFGEDQITVRVFAKDGSPLNAAMVVENASGSCTGVCDGHCQVTPVFAAAYTVIVEVDGQEQSQEVVLSEDDRLLCVDCCEPLLIEHLEFVFD